MTPAEFTAICKRYEFYESDIWSPDVILKHEKLSNVVVDPCTGSGILSEAAKRAGYDLVPLDIYDWNYPDTVIQDWLALDALPFEEFSIIMNPPFSKAVEFVRKGLQLGANKLLVYQRFSWWESNKRKKFFDKYPPSKVYVLGDRGACFRHDLSAEWRKGRSTPTAHAWFVWEQGYQGKTILDRIYKG